jgi:hypothetical protein
MGHLFKHMAVRLWTTLVIGSLVALAVLPPVAGTVGPSWMVVPCLGLFTLVFWLAGMAFAAMGRRRLARLLKEATVWDRAGMTREAQQVFVRAATVVDSFLFSPFNRRDPAGRLLKTMARFQLAQAAPESSSDAIIGAYLRQFPRDRVAAVKWLDGVLAGRPLTSQSHEIATRIGSAHPDDGGIQRMLAQFYLDEGRCDFAALQTYRHLIEAGPPLSERLLASIADLFMAQPRVDTLALKVYLDLQQRGRRDQRLIPAIAACTRMIHPSPVTLPLLERAQSLLADIDSIQRDEMAAGFAPAMTDSSHPHQFKTQPGIGAAVVRRTQQSLVGVGRRFSEWAVHGGKRLRNGLALFSNQRTKSIFKWSSMGLLALGVGWLVLNTALHLQSSPPTKEQAPLPKTAPITDPFTLQVAAYLKEADARRYVEQLKASGLDAYWTRASGAKKTWYQVRISHFKTKADARAMGDDLKKRQLITDYYVANYKHPNVP